MKNKKSLIDVLDLCADLFAFPSDDWCEKYYKLGEFAKGEFASSFDEFSNSKFKKLLNSQICDNSEIISNYIKYFDLNSAKFGTSLLGGVWLDKKMFGKSYDEICNFYEFCGYEIHKNCDHLSNLLAFCAILAENNEFDKFNKFVNFLIWLRDLKINISQIYELKEFEFILAFSEFAIFQLRRK